PRTSTWSGSCARCGNSSGTGPAGPTARWTAAACRTPPPPDPAGGTGRGPPPPGSRPAGASAVQPDGERGLQVVLGVRAERDVRVRALDAGDLADPAGDDLGQVLVLPDPDHRDQVVGAGDGEDLADAVQRGDPLRDLGDPVHAGLDEDDRGDHGWFSPSGAGAGVALTVVVRPEQTHAQASPRPKPTRCARQATPGPSDARPAPSHCSPAQNGSTTQAGKRTGRKNRNGRRLVTRARGNRKRNAPRTAEIAPDAPTTDCGEPVSARAYPSRARYPQQT